MTKGNDDHAGLKSAYELALARLEGQGIEPPRQQGLPEDVQREMAEVRSRAEAKMAEMEILHRDRRQKAGGVLPPEEEDRARQERTAIEAKRDRELAAIRERASER